ncbi:S-layer homology domain-containing protein [Brevibacillus humidisoli]|uniref:S-layer homology domain-containing protein n=1 Tax=Brevibacillus humidisoli TaxID=2895522 RepID=UPI001E63179A|nr:S-layer homology domain-containing protein [Brevibacillus humidisoli]UFJ40988.1 S-layer homology domain-containing protein [Brevibacillus humidisoli]
MIIRTNWVLASLVATCLVFPIIPPSTAADTPSQTTRPEAKIESAEAIAIAQNLVAVPDSYTEPTVQKKTYGPSEIPVWDVSWRSEQDKQGWIHVTIDADSGIVREFSYRNHNLKPVFPPALSMREAADAARNWLKKTTPNQQLDYQLDPDQWKKTRTILLSPREEYELEFSPMIDGIPFADQRIEVMVRGDGTILEMRRDGPDAESVTFEPVENMLSPDAVMETLRKETGVVLATFIETDYSGEKPQEKQGSFTYELTHPLYYIDAHTGQHRNYHGDVIPFRRTDEASRLHTDQMAEAPTSTSTGSPDQPVSPEQVKQLFLQTYIPPEGVTLHQVVKGPSWPKCGCPFYYAIDAEYESLQGTHRWAIAAYDEKGNLFRFNLAPLYKPQEGDFTFRQPPEGPFPVTPEQAEKTATAFVQKVNAGYLDQLYADNNAYGGDADGAFYRFSYERKVDGVNVQSDRITVEVSKKTGEVVLYEREWSENLTIPPKEQFITPEQAKRLYLEASRLRLQYTLFRSEGARSGSSESAPATAQLVYDFLSPGNQGYSLDALTGKIIDNRTGEERKSPEDTPAQRELPADIRDHAAGRELAHLLQLGAIQVGEDGLLHPERSISRGEFYDIWYTLEHPHRYLSPSWSKSQPTVDREPSFADVSADHPYYQAIEWAVERKRVATTMSNFEPDRPITREEALVSLVNALGYAELASDDELFQLPFADQDQIKQRGHVALGMKMELLQVSGDTFQPAESVSLGEAADMLYRYMVRKAEKTQEEDDDD